VGVGFSWGNLLRKGSPKPLPNLFGLWLTVCVVDMGEKGDLEYSVEYGLNLFHPLTYSGKNHEE